MAGCLRCGGEMSATGALYSPVRMSFRPADAKFLTFETGDVMTRAVMCRQCGMIEIVGDVNKLHRLAGDPEATRPAEPPEAGDS